jgi:murein DD-endopeptidase MepM/ murein hydrolase activator NlpD
MRFSLVLWAIAATAGAQPVSPLRLDPIEPAAWAPSDRSECYSREEGPDGVVAQARICDGPRRVPLLEGDLAERARLLGLGTRPAVDRLRVHTPLREWVEAVHSTAREDLLWPVARGLFSRGFGFVREERIRHRPHLGVDIVAEEGARIRAANDGLVVYADNGVRGYGNFLAIVHADGSSTFYGHCRAIFVAPGQIVARGQTVAEVGHTGLAQRAHLHFEWHRGGEAIDPMARFVERPEYHDIRPDGGEGFATPPPNVTDEAQSASIIDDEVGS